MNFNQDYKYNKEKFPPWLLLLIIDFLSDYDTHINSKTRSWALSYNGSKCLCEWLKSKNWKVSWWALPPLYELTTEIYFAYGIEFEESCTLFTEYKLKSTT